MKYIHCLFIVFTLFIGCKNVKSQKNNTTNKTISAPIDIHSFLGNEKWIEVSKIDSKYVNYKRCDSENRFIKIVKDDFIENVGQETFTCKVLRWDKVSEFEYIVSINNGCSYDDKFKLEILDANSKIIKWTNKLYSFVSVSESMLDDYKIVNQPCTDCFSKEECNDVNNNNNVGINNKSFNKPKSVVIPNNSWFGEYYFEERKTGKVILISKDKMTYEATGIRYQAKYQLSANQVGDTLGLYYHKGLLGDSDNLEAYQPLIKLYRKKGKYFIKTILTDDNWKETEIEKF